MLFIVCLIQSSRGFCGWDNSQESLRRAEEILNLRLEQGYFKSAEVVPALVVSVAPAFEESRKSFQSSALSVLGQVFGAGSLRLCEACDVPQSFATGGKLESRVGTVSLEDLRQIDMASRGEAPPARSAIWLEETHEGVSLRILEIATGRVIYAENVTPLLVWSQRSRKNYDLTKDLERRDRGESLTHSFFDIGIYPTPHLAIDWSEQWGMGNEHLSGITLSFFTPLLGIGPHYARVIPSMFNALLGGKLMLSAPTALVSAVAQRNTTVLDPLATLIAFVRVPIAGTSLGGFFYFASTGKVGIGVSSLQTSFLPPIVP
jgi:hypothetical protein